MGVESADEPPAAVERGELAEVIGTDDFAFVDELNDEIGALVEDAHDLRYDYVVGDVSGPGTSSRGHLHFDLVRDGSSMHCVRFGGWPDDSDGAFEDGELVAVKGDLSYHQAEGQVSIVVDHVVALGEGSYRKVYERARQALEADGLLDDDAKQPLPAYPRCVGIVTSIGSDAHEDAVTSLHGRHPGVDIVIQGATVQGEAAMGSMMRAISRLDEDARVEVIVLTRGGGADRHLRVFNETPLCRVIHHAGTPVVVGVGHENDRTLADEVADHRVMTPTEVGETVPRRDELEETVETAAGRLDATFSRAASNRLATWGDDLEAAYERRVSAWLEAATSRVDHAFDTAAAQRLTAYDNRLDHALQAARQQQAYETEHARARRRQRLVVAVLVAIVLVLLGYILVTGP